MIQDYVTRRDVARTIGGSIMRVRVLEKRGVLRPVESGGRTKYFDRAAVEKVLGVEILAQPTCRLKDSVSVL